MSTKIYKFLQYLWDKQIQIQNTKYFIHISYYMTKKRYLYGHSVTPALLQNMESIWCVVYMK